MPGGFGIYDGGRPTTAESSVLSHATISGGTVEQLIQSADAAVTMLLARNALISKDILAPFAYPLAATGTRGGPVKLQFSDFDDSGRASATIVVRSGVSKQVALFRVPLRAVAANQLQRVTWQSPKQLPPRLSFCIVATDPAGNRSRQSCAAMKLG
jgi:hypothetical protein